jgi:hypothetical protein
MAILEKFKKAAIVAIGFVLLRISAVDGFCTVVWQAYGLPDLQPITSILQNRPVG